MNEEIDEVTQVMRVDDKDWFLQSLIDMVNAGSMSFGITLNVGGFLVSGTLIGGKEYFEGFGEDFATMIKETDSAKKVKDAFAKNGEIYDSKEDLPPASYIHIKEARFFNTNGTPIPSSQGVWWRGRVSNVDGFSLGSLSA